MKSLYGAYGMGCLLLLGVACSSKTGVPICTRSSAPAPVPSTQVAGNAPSLTDKWEPAIQKFEQADRASPPPRDAVLFVGSSSIRMWKEVDQDFPGVPVINRGFGGSQISDSTRYLDRIIAPYQPRMIVFYAGDNDIAGGHTPQQVFADYQEFVRQVRGRLPHVPIAYISIKPSPARAKFLQATRQANELIRQYIATRKDLSYIDVFTSMLGADGQPRPELFTADRLHLNRQGYDLWTAQVAPFVQSVMKNNP